jgi:hypothetical protein
MMASVRVLKMQSMVCDDEWDAEVHGDNEDDHAMTLPV